MAVCAPTVLDDIVRDLFDAPDELRAEDQDVRFRQIDAVLDLLRGIAEVQRDGDRTCLEHAEIDRQPIEAVHEQDRDLVALDDAAREQEIRDAVGLFVKYSPGDLCPVRNLAQGLDEFILFPGRETGDFYLGVQFHEGDVIRIFAGIFFQKVCNNHDGLLLCPGLHSS